MHMQVPQHMEQASTPVAVDMFPVYIAAPPAAAAAGCCCIPRPCLTQVQRVLVVGLAIATVLFSFDLTSKPLSLLRPAAHSNGAVGDAGAFNPPPPPLTEATARGNATTPNNTTTVSDADNASSPTTTAAVPLPKNPRNSSLVKFCIDHAPYACDNRGSDVCRWTATPATAACEFQNFSAATTVQASPAAATHRNLVFHGDSMLREVFSAMGGGGVGKSDTNMSSRAIVRRTAPGLNLTFRFDYTVDHLQERIAAADLLPSEHSQGVPDAVVLGIGLYHARSIHGNTTIYVNTTTGQTMFLPGNTYTMPDIVRSAAVAMQSLVCDQYQAPVGFFVGAWMECAHLKIRLTGPGKRKPRMSYQQCSQEHALIKTINYAVQSTLSNLPARPDGCVVHYVPPIKCQMNKRPCLADSVHTRPGGNYANAKAQVLLNAIGAALM